MQFITHELIWISFLMITAGRILFWASITHPGNTVMQHWDARDEQQSGGLTI